jgi:hypothetical protein
MRSRLTVALVVVFVSACGGPTKPSDNIVDQFTGTVQPSNLDLKPFDIGNTGEYTVKLTALTPGTSVLVGVLFGQPGGGTCQPVQQPNYVNNSYIGRTVLSGSIIVKGPYCVLVFDPVNVATQSPWPVAQTYGLEVSHP